MFHAGKTCFMSSPRPVARDQVGAGRRPRRFHDASPVSARSDHRRVHVMNRKHTITAVLVVALAAIVAALAGSVNAAVKASDAHDLDRRRPPDGRHAGRQPVGRQPRSPDQGRPEAVRQHPRRPRHGRRGRRTRRHRRRARLDRQARSQRPRRSALSQGGDAEAVPQLRNRRVLVRHRSEEALRRPGGDRERRPRCQHEACEGADDLGAARA